MSVINKAVNGFFTFNNKQYRLPNIQTNNRKNFDVMKKIMGEYTYNEFAKNFDHIYNNSDDYSKVMCCYMREICEQYDTLKKNDPSSGFGSIVCKIKIEAECEFRPNNRHFHVNYINLVLYWKYYKISYNNCNTIRLFNDLLKDLELPNDLRSGFPELVDIFKEGLKPVIETVNDAHAEYWKAKNEKEFKLEFKNKLKEYESYLNTIRKECGNIIDSKIYDILFKDYSSNFKIYITNILLKKLIENDKYKSLKDKYEYIELDDDTMELSEDIYDYFGYYAKNLNTKLTPEEICKRIEFYIEDIYELFGYHKPTYKFKSKEHVDLLMNLLQ